MIWRLVSQRAWISESSPECGRVYFDEEGKLSADKTSFGGNFLGKIVFADENKMAVVTARPGVLKEAASLDRKGEIIAVSPEAILRI